jgi:hypothetical protein
VWFGVLLAVNMQTSFMHPPFGFALFYLRSVAPNEDYVDKVTKKPTKRVTIEQIYWGAVPFVIIQIVMVGLIIAFPGLVSSGLTKDPTVDADQVIQQMEVDKKQESDDQAAAAIANPASAEEADDPMKRMMESIKDDAAKK